MTSKDQTRQHVIVIEVLAYVAIPISVAKQSQNTIGAPWPARWMWCYSIKIYPSKAINVKRFKLNDQKTQNNMQGKTSEKQQRLEHTMAMYDKPKRYLLLILFVFQEKYHLFSTKL